MDVFHSAHAHYNLQKNIHRPTDSLMVEYSPSVRETAVNSLVVLLQGYKENQWLTS